MVQYGLEQRVKRRIENKHRVWDWHRTDHGRMRASAHLESGPLVLPAGERWLGGTGLVGG